MSNVVKLHPPTVVESILESLNEKARTPDELYVLRAHIDPVTGERHLEWYTTACDSRIWSVGALHYLAHKIMSAGHDDSWYEDDPERENEHD